jgi:teichuronic acid exporter
MIVTSFFWKFCERSSVQFFQFIIMLVIAAFLAPGAFGEILLIMSIVLITNICITGGLTLSLIQNIDSTEKDFSTLFYFNLIIATILYSLLFIISPIIAPFFDEINEFEVIIRVLGLLLFISSFQVIQQAYVMKHQQFRSLCVSSIVAAFVAASIVLLTISLGGGVWAFVAWHLAFNFFQMVILHIYIRWLPTTGFSFQSMRSIMGFGWKLTASSLIDSAYTNGQYIFIGNLFSPATLAFYNRGEQFPNLLINNLNSTLQSVLLPQLAKYQHNRIDFKQFLRNSIATSSFIIFLLLFCLATFADPLIKFLFQDSWLPLITYVQLFCFVFAFWPVHTIYLQALNALGRSDLFLKLELLKKSLSIIVLVSVFPFGIKAVMISMGILSIGSLLINGFPLKKLVGYSLMEQFRDIGPSFITSALLTVLMILLQTFLSTNVIFIMTTILVGIFLYIFIAKLLQLQGYLSIKAFLNQLPTLYKEKIILRKKRLSNE